MKDFEVWWTKNSANYKTGEDCETAAYDAYLYGVGKQNQVKQQVRQGQDGESGEVKATCAWKQDEDGNWWTDCDNAFCLNDGSPFENEMKFCCYCGQELKESRFDA